MMSERARLRRKTDHPHLQADRRTDALACFLMVLRHSHLSYREAHTCIRHVVPANHVSPTSKVNGRGIKVTELPSSTLLPGEHVILSPPSRRLLFARILRRDRVAEKGGKEVSRHETIGAQKDGKLVDRQLVSPKIYDIQYALQRIRGQCLIKRRSRLKVAGKKDAVDVRAFERNLSNGLARSSSFYLAAAAAV